MIDTSNSMQYYISNLNIQNERISYSMGTGNAINKGSDDSVLHTKLINLEDKLKVTESLNLQITKTKAINDTADSNISEVKTALEAIKLDLMKALNDGMDPSDKLALATNLKGLRENIIDRANVEIDGEYIFSGSESTKQTLEKDADFKNNGKVEFGGDAFLRKIAVQPGIYRDRGVTAYDVSFYPSSTVTAGNDITFEKNERVIDSDGYEWKLSFDGNKMQRYDHNDILSFPIEEVDVYRPMDEPVEVDLGIGTNSDANGNYIIEIDGNVFTSTATGVEDANTIFTDLKTQIEAHPNGYSVSNALVGNDKFYVTAPANSSSISLKVSDTDSAYDMTATNEVEATTTTQSKQATWTFTLPGTPEGRVIEAKHNYFEDLNRVINALEGHSTKLDGTRGYAIDTPLVDEIVTDILDRTSLQFDATNVGHGELGGRNAIFNNAQLKLETQITNYNILMQEYGGADLAKLAMESKALELTYQSLYSTIAKMNELSLVNYIK